MNVVMIGTGNAATILGRMIVKAGHQIVQVAGRNATQTRLLASEFNSEPINTFNAVTTQAEMYIIAVSDSAVTEVAQQLPKLNKTVVHTTGSVTRNVLQNVSDACGVLYPLQSLRKEMKSLPAVPLFVDGSDEKTTAHIINFAKTISASVAIADDEQRLKLHIAAVLASNFTNYLYSIAESFCLQEHINFKHLLPLIEETATRLENYTPSQMQTGPAARGDVATINKHLQLLNAHPEIKKLYELLSNNIMQRR